MSATDKKKKGGGRLGVTLFGGIFLVVGLGVMIAGPLETLYQHWRSAGWQRVPVVLHSINVSSHRGDKSTTYSVSARYSYQLNGRTWQGDRVGYDWGSDNIGDYHDRIVGQVYAAQARGELRAWVNPDDPSESYLMHQLRWKKIFFGLMFGLVFAGAGAGIIAFGWRKGAAPAVAGEAIYSSNRYGHWVMAFMSFMFLGISSPVMMDVPTEINKGNWLILVALVFPLVGIGMGWAAWKMRRKWLYYGPLPLTLDPFPGQIGGDIAGTISLPKWYGDSHWKVTLQCVRVRISRGKNSSRHESPVWQKEQFPYVEAQGQGMAVRFAFQPPADLPASDDEGREQIEWRLQLEGPKTPVPLERTYSLPAEPGTATATRPLPQSHVARAEREALLEATSEAAEQIDVEQIPGGLRLYSRVGRNRGMTVVLVVTGLMFAGGSVGLFIAAAKEGFMLYVMGFFFGLFGFPMFIGGLFMAGRALEARIVDGEVRVVRYWLGRALWQRQGRLEHASQLKLTDAGSANTGTEMIRYFHIEAMVDGRKLRLAEGLAGQDVAEALRDNLIRLLRLS